MAQTNFEIILNESIALMNEGKIGSTGRKITMVIEKNGEKIKEQIDEPEPIKTYAEWKRLGRQVQKGQKAIAQFTIWNYTEGKKKDQEEEKEQQSLMKNGYFYMKKASFFKASQTEAITA